MRNHEGYKDTTAGKAIRKVDRERRKKREDTGQLMYLLEEVPGFPGRRKSTPVGV